MCHRRWRWPIISVEETLTEFAAMETTEKIVESYCRYVKHWFTIPNIRCRGQYEIDLLAIDTTRPGELARYHIECGVSISGSFSKLTDKEFSKDLLKVRVQAPSQRRTLGFFLQRKFDVPEVWEKLKEFGFVGKNFKRVIVTWDSTAEAKKSAEQHGVVLWDFRDLVRKIAAEHRKNRAYFTDDTARTIQLYDMATKRDATGRAITQDDSDGF